MAINTGGYAVNGSIPTLIGPTTKPVVFNYANGQTMAPSSGGAAYAQGMEQAGQSLGAALQQVAQNLNPVAQAQKRQQIAQANMQTQLTPEQQALMQAQMQSQIGQANMQSNVYDRINQKMAAQAAAQQALAAQQAQGQQTPVQLQGLKSTPSPTLAAPAQGNPQLAGLSPAPAANIQSATPINNWSVNSTPESVDIPGAGTYMIDIPGLTRDPNFMNAAAQNTKNTNLDAGQARADFNSNDIVKNYEDAGRNANVLYQMKQKLDAGQSLTPAEGNNLINAYAFLMDPNKAKGGVPATTIISQATYPQQFETELAKFSKDKNTLFSNQTGLDAINAGLSNFGNMTNQYRALQTTGIAQAKGSNLDKPQLLNSIYPDKPSIIAQQYKWDQRQKQSSQPSANRDQLKNTVAAIIQKHPDWSPVQVKQAAASGQY